ncbi:hypothetical protein L3Y19_gp053 [Gordonia phage Neville]|uniref:Uncharacterized protein n=2 Tax=Nevillevirus TaxID=3044773 RepID=A0A515MGZ5_9CAUD|nr:hypothetical protein L3Y19_gp053 [Gordonia phage Neville]YP_010246037.1 hypothetical protein L3Y20_gp052 [Gordonia phage Trax]AXQ64422.1 hypothetical protein SEA_NEVILLE_53 [Gordonia phage Neville]QDM55939.1 hypothetical protein SEA_TRAX_52 [Gordonia phage Trax]
MTIALLDIPDYIDMGEFGFSPVIPESHLIVDSPVLDPVTGEPVVEVDQMVLDRDGSPWAWSGSGWMAAGDWRSQPWEKVKQWF